MPHYVGDGFAQSQRQHCFLGRSQRQFSDIGIHRNARSLQSLARPYQLRSQPFAAITADGFAHIGQGRTRGVLHIQHFLFGALRIAVHKFARQFRFQRDERQRVA